MEIARDISVSLATREIAKRQGARNRLPFLKRRLAECQLAPGAAIAGLKVVDQLRDVYESIAPPETRFGRISLILISDDEVEICESIDELFDELDALDTKDQLWPLMALMLFDKTEQLARFQESEFGSALQAIERGSRAHPVTSVAA